MKGQKWLKGISMDSREDISGHLCPVKSDWDDGETREATKDLVNDDIIWLDPGDECEDGEELGDEAREPVGRSISALEGDLNHDSAVPIPNERAKKNIGKHPVAADSPAIGFCRVGLAVIM
jgi:hypothetical protein